MPIMDIVVGALLLQHDVGITLVKLAVELSVLLNGLKLLDTIDLNRILTSLSEEGLSLGTHLADIFFEVLSIELAIVVVCFNHRLVLLFKS